MIAVQILEHRLPAPWQGLGWTQKLYAPIAQYLESLVKVIGAKYPCGALADLLHLHARSFGTVFPGFRLLKNDTEIALLGRCDDEPSRSAPVGCILQLLETKDLRELTERFLLIAHQDGDEAQSVNHVSLLLRNESSFSVLADPRFTPVPMPRVRARLAERVEDAHYLAAVLRAETAPTGSGAFTDSRRGVPSGAARKYCTGQETENPRSCAT